VSQVQATARVGTTGAAALQLRAGTLHVGVGARGARPARRSHGHTTRGFWYPHASGSGCRGHVCAPPRSSCSRLPQRRASRPASNTS
jgi:hypothetical protein